VLSVLVVVSFLFGIGVAHFALTKAPNGDVATSVTAPRDSPAHVPATASIEAPTPDSARSAAIAYATAPQQWLYMSDNQIRRAVRAAATPTSATRLTDDVVREISFARDALRKSSGRVWWLVRPLADRLDSYSGTDADVTVWTVTILSATGVAAPQADWLITTLHLKWTGAWRVSSVTSSPGPTPTCTGRTVPWDAEHLDQTLAGFRRVGAVDPK
jgi:hypothetical protein